jgi:uncharacterized protein
MEIDKNFLDKMIHRILSVARPERVILFGSAASGAMTTESDIDILVIEKGFRNQRQENGRLRSALADLGVPVDVFTMTPERFAETKDVIGGLAYPANKYGKVIYEAA